MRQAAIFALEKKKINKKQDARTAHAHCNFQETKKHIRETAKALRAEQCTNRRRV